MKLYNMNCLDYLQSDKFVKDVRGGNLLLSPILHSTLGITIEPTKTG